MRTLLRTLQDHDPGFLRAVCELWGLDYPGGTSREVIETVSAAMLDPQQFEEMIDSLPESARPVIDNMIAEGGKASFAQVDRSFGPLREMGPGRRDREQPWRQPASPLEMVWYRGLLGRAFADSPVGPQEFIYLPLDLIPLLAPGSIEPANHLGLEADDPDVIDTGDSSAVDDATTLLAAFRMQPPRNIPISPDRRAELFRYLHQPHAIDLLVQLLLDSGFLDPESRETIPERVGSFMDASRAEALKLLISAWHDSYRWNDLAALTHLQFASDDWPNDPRASREAALELLRPLPIGEWWDLSAFLSGIREHHPAFQRPGGDFKAWYLQDGSGAFLNGIEHWDSVDGAYLRYLIEGPLHWLGAVDLGRPSPNRPVRSFRFTPAREALFSDQISLKIEEQDSKIIVQANGEVIVPRGADRVTRYQIARISAWEPPDRLGHRFRLTPGTLQAASEQGLSTRHILHLLEKATESELPPSVIRAVERWSQAGMEAQLMSVLLLRVERPEILEKLTEQKSTSSHIAEILSPTTAIIQEANWPALRDAAARLGLLLEPPERRASTRTGRLD